MNLKLEEFIGPAGALVMADQWFKRPEFRYKNSKLNLLAIQILSEIIYWYRAIEVRDELTGKTVGWKKKFCSDKLQIDYARLSCKFACTPLQASRACNFLAKKGLITLELRHNEKAGKLLLVEPVVENIKKSLTPYVPPE